MALKIVDSYSELNVNSYTGVQSFGDTNNQGLGGIGQSFTGDGGVLNSVKFYLSKGGTITGNAFVYIYEHSGTFGSSSVPTGSPLATSDAFDVSALTTSATLITFNFSGANKITLSNGTKYVVTIQYTGGSWPSNYIAVGQEAISSSHPGNICFYINSISRWGVDPETDVCFYVYADGPSSSPLPTHFNL
jgi:hypothetical protein